MDPADRQQIYTQRYETYRHLDRLRWQMFQLAVVMGSGVLAFGKATEAAPEWWVLATAGLLFASFGIVMERIRHGIARNGEMLKVAAEHIGDTGIPIAAPWRKNISFWIAIALIAAGLLCLGLSANLLCGGQ